MRSLVYTLVRLKSPEDLRAVYRDDWGAIRTHTRPGKIQSTYTFSYQQLSPSVLRQHLDDIFRSQNSRFKINFSHSFVLRNKKTKELRFYHASNNNNAGLDAPLLINNQHDFDDFLALLQEHDPLEQAQS